MMAVQLFTYYNIIRKNSNILNDVSIGKMVVGILLAPLVLPIMLMVALAKWGAKKKIEGDLDELKTKMERISDDRGE